MTFFIFGFNDADVCVYVFEGVCVCCDSQLVNTISQEGKLGQISYLSTGSLLFLVEVKGHLWSTGVKA